MVFGTRRGVPALAMVVIAAGIALIRLPPRRVADPCAANPAVHACAIFDAPGWLTRRVHAGRAQEASMSAGQAASSVNLHDVLAISGKPSIRAEAASHNPGGV
ncbi:hypothetical protein [Methylobacterium planeticum]|uniref:Uncharacterized protein n=1 Tax=Methylobacterium planeticum TaxID=2615211 RepID=A0A6N6MPW9_9HYPH|nr:hypothetical protein [Methylobacterium planeticum]KAB1072604.1 hypothetical protein F6X51_15040 [Methylobacterium planeticum]